MPMLGARGGHPRDRRCGYGLVVQESVDRGNTIVHPSAVRDAVARASVRATTEVPSADLVIVGLPYGTRTGNKEWLSAQVAIALTTTPVAMNGPGPVPLSGVRIG